jgi:hypothetical protein
MGISFLHPVTMSQKQVDAGLSAITNPSPSPSRAIRPFARETRHKVPQSPSHNKHPASLHLHGPVPLNDASPPIFRPLLVPLPDPIILLSQYILPQPAQHASCTKDKLLSEPWQRPPEKLVLPRESGSPCYKCLKQLLTSIVSYTSHSNRRERVKLGQRDKQDCVF